MGGDAFHKSRPSKRDATEPLTVAAVISLSNVTQKSWLDGIVLPGGGSTECIFARGMGVEWFSNPKVSGGEQR